jgi:hypothetical protein
MSFIKHDPNQGPPPQALMDAMGAYVEASFKAGGLIDTGGLAPVADGITVRMAGRKLSVLDGPFTEAKEVVGGYAVLECGSRDEALEAAKRFMELHLEHWPDFVGECEVRQIFGPEG